MTKEETKDLLNEAEKILAEEANLIQLQSGIRISVENAFLLDGRARKHHPNSSGAN